MQGIQLAAHRAMAKADTSRLLPNPLPAPVRVAIAAATPGVQWATARFIGRGFRPESVAAELR
jgi:hypothetical protein